MSWYLQLKYKFWRKRIYKTVMRITTSCLFSYTMYSEQCPNAPKEKHWKKLLARRGHTEEIITGVFGEVDSLRDLVSIIASEEIPLKFDPIIKRSLKSKYDIFEDKEPKPWETYSSLYEIVSSVIPDNI